MDSKCFLFDLVILNVWVPGFDYDEKPITIDVTFNKTDFTIESNPDKPGEFKQGRSCEFTASPDELQNDLKENPLKLTVKTTEEQVIGTVEMKWPPDLLEKLGQETFMQFSHFDQCNVMDGKTEAGKVGIQYRLRTKCEESEMESEMEDEEEGYVKKTCDIKSELKRIVNPNELFFLIKNDSESCTGATGIGDAPPHTCPPTALDLKRFKFFHGKVVRDPEIFDQVYSLDCCHVKKYPTDDCCKKTVCKPPLPMCPEFDDKPDDSQVNLEFACKAAKHIKECPHSNKFSSETGSCSCECMNSEEKKNIFTNGKMKNICSCPQSPPVLKEDVYIRARPCPVCNSDVSWLPKLAACPKCGHKPTPYAEERPYNENLTAEQIIQEWGGDIPIRKEDKGCKRTNRCSCKNGKICAYCRIQKLCKNFIRSKKSNETTVGPKKERSQEGICKSSSGNESRTYLARVFSELRDLYNLKPDTKPQAFEKSIPCEKAFKAPTKPKSNRTFEPKQKPSNTSTRKNKPQMTTNLTAEEKDRLCRGKKYSYKGVRKYPGTIIGHKECVSSGKSVPPHMGWLWTAEAVGSRTGYRPGAIRKPIKEIMKYFLKDYPVDTLGVSRYSHRKVSRKESEELIQKPTLHICKKNGAYIITMRPLKDATLLKDCADPYVPMKPIRFKIVKNPLLVHSSQIKKQLKKQFHKCTCHRPVSACYCRTYLDKKRLEFELSKLCRQRCIPSLKDNLVLSDTSDSDEEFDFGVTPPAGVIKPELRNRPNLACRETQYNESDCNPKPTIPSKLNKYQIAFDLAGGRLCPPCVCRGGHGGPTGPTAAVPPKSGATVPGGVGIGAASGGKAMGTGRFTLGAPLFCNLARRRKLAECCAPPCMPCMPCIC